MIMTTLTNGERSIDMALSKEITIEDKQYALNLPKITCSKFDDAQYMQEKINEFVNNLSREVIKN